MWYNPAQENLRRNPQGFFPVHVGKNFMIVSCSSCMKRYYLDGDILGSQGRQVRCTHCGHTWHQLSPPPPQLAVVVKNTPSNLPDKRFPPRKWRFLSVSLLVFLFIAALVTFTGASLFLWNQWNIHRENSHFTLKFLPEDAQSSIQPLEILTLSFRSSSTGIVIEGYLHNTSTKAALIPPLLLRFVKQTTEGARILHSISHTFADNIINPGETRFFSIPCENSPDNFSIIIPSFR